MGNQCCPQTLEPIKTQNYNKEEHHEINVVIIPENKQPEPTVESGQGTVHPNQAETGTIALPDGSSYTGFLKAGVPHGKGKEVHEGGD